MEIRVEIIDQEDRHVSPHHFKDGTVSLVPIQVDIVTQGPYRFAKLICRYPHDEPKGKTS